MVQAKNVQFFTVYKRLQDVEYYQDLKVYNKLNITIVYQDAK